MRHMKRGRKLNRTASHRKAMLANLAMSVLHYERVSTTVEKAKEVRRLVERLITYGKKGSLGAIRMAARYINNKTLLKKLFDDIALRYKDRVGGYVRIVKTVERKGDNASLCMIELVGRNAAAPAAADSPAKGKGKAKGRPAQEPAAGDATVKAADDAAAPSKRPRRVRQAESEGVTPRKSKSSKRLPEESSDK